MPDILLVKVLTSLKLLNTFLPGVDKIGDVFLSDAMTLLVGDTVG